MEKDERAKEAAEAALENIKDMIKRCHTNEEGEYDEGYLNDEVLNEIYEAPLSVLVRSDWYSPGEIPPEAVEYMILLTTGGPAVQLIGTLDKGSPDSVQLQYQDWGTPWCDYPLDKESSEILLEFAQLVIPS
ncbi:hypothetical protein DMB44_04220 [Thermoplasma sp. Kam2015]|uniref:hypothetical protein n=1 Tax=Thermoplasma sp. Kam2015 TaxID=2094122 RepID=UPI000D9D8711|nr:hypothetical protein [Thermoplasma sp. Kam2015]PYB68546.1 hypothetical protein DMB44_04220 [Thermoplasma sp. Kam2015]